MGRKAELVEVLRFIRDRAVGGGAPHQRRHQLRPRGAPPAARVPHRGRGGATCGASASADGGPPPRPRTQGIERRRPALASPLRRQPPAGQSLATAAVTGASIFLGSDRHLPQGLLRMDARPPPGVLPPPAPPAPLHLGTPPGRGGGEPSCAAPL